MTESLSSYRIKLDVFEGPLELLLFLIKSKKIDIHDIPIAMITKEYLQYLDQKEKINLEREAEFLLMASLLIYIKSQMLLPRVTIEDDEEDPRQILVDQLQEYQKIQAASSFLRDKEESQLEKWQRESFHPGFSLEDTEFLEVSLFDLSEAFFNLMKKNESSHSKVIQGREISAEEKMKEMLDCLNKKSFFDFSEYFSLQETREEAFLSFFCLLELIKSQIAIAIQENLFEPIKVWARNVRSR